MSRRRWRHDPFCGVRVGEAKRPGPTENRLRMGMRFGTVNVTAFLNKPDLVTAFEADVLAVQETKLAALGQQEASEELRELG